MTVPLYPPGTILDSLGGDEPWGIILAGHLSASEVEGEAVHEDDISHRWAVHDENGWWPDDTATGVAIAALAAHTYLAGKRVESHDARVAATLWRPK